MDGCTNSGYDISQLEVGYGGWAFSAHCSSSMVLIRTRVNTNYTRIGLSSVVILALQSFEL